MIRRSERTRLKSLKSYERGKCGECGEHRGLCGGCDGCGVCGESGGCGEYGECDECGEERLPEDAEGAENAERLDVWWVKTAEEQDTDRHNEKIEQVPRAAPEREAQAVRVPIEQKLEEEDGVAHRTESGRRSRSHLSVRGGD
jgi:hypothetical protein